MSWKGDYWEDNWNGENPMVRDELWDDSGYGKDYDDEDCYKPPAGYTDVAVEVHFDKLNDKELAEFEKDMEILDTFEYPPTVEWFWRKKYVTVNGWMNESEEETFDEIWFEKYDLDCYENWLG